jgi:[ribosomal protein S5]-alanine N-acetyltransferase
MNFILRSWKMTDLHDLVLYANNINISKNLRDIFPHPYTPEDGEAFINFATKNTEAMLFAIVLDGFAAGGIGIHPQDDIHKKNAELGYWLAEPYWGNGIVSEAIKQIVAMGFERYDITRIFATVFKNNVASQKVLEKAGFKIEAAFEKTIFKNGVFLDEIVYAIRK